MLWLSEVVAIRDKSADLCNCHLGDVKCDFAICSSVPSEVYFDDYLGVLSFVLLKQVQQIRFEQALLALLQFRSVKLEDVDCRKLSGLLCSFHLVFLKITKNYIMLN